MKSHKASDLNGFQPIFFKIFWNDVGDDGWKFVRSAFKSDSFDYRAVETLLVLIPKRDNSSSFNEF